MYSIGSTARIFWDSPLKRQVPTGIFKVIVMKIDRSVLGRVDLNVRHGAGPVVAGHRPSRKVDDTTVKVVWSGVAAAVRADVAWPCQGLAWSAQRPEIARLCQRRSGASECGGAAGRPGGQLELFGQRAENTILPLQYLLS